MANVLYYAINKEIIDKNDKKLVQGILSKFNEKGVITKDNASDVADVLNAAIANKFSIENAGDIMVKCIKVAPNTIEIDNFITTIKNNRSSINKETLERLKKSANDELKNENEKVKELLENLLGQLETILSEKPKAEDPEVEPEEEPEEEPVVEPVVEPKVVEPEVEKSKVNNREETEESNPSNPSDTTGGSSVTPPAEPNTSDSDVSKEKEITEITEKLEKLAISQPSAARIKTLNATWKEFISSKNKSCKVNAVANAFINAINEFPNNTDIKDIALETLNQFNKKDLIKNSNMISVIRLLCQTVRNRNSQDLKENQDLKDKTNNILSKIQSLINDTYETYAFAIIYHFITTKDLESINPDLYESILDKCFGFQNILVEALSNIVKKDNYKDKLNLDFISKYMQKHKTEGENSTYSIIKDDIEEEEEEEIKNKIKEILLPNQDSEEIQNEITRIPTANPSPLVNPTTPNSSEAPVEPTQPTEPVSPSGDNVIQDEKVIEHVLTEEEKKIAKKLEELEKSQPSEYTKKLKEAWENFIKSSTKEEKSSKARDVAFALNAAMNQGFIDKKDKQLVQGILTKLKENITTENTYSVAYVLIIAKANGVVNDDTTTYNDMIQCCINANAGDVALALYDAIDTENLNDQKLVEGILSKFNEKGVITKDNAGDVALALYDAIDTGNLNDQKLVEGILSKFNEKGVITKDNARYVADVLNAAIEGGFINNNDDDKQLVEGILSKFNKDGVITQGNANIVAWALKAAIANKFSIENAGDIMVKCIKVAPNTISNFINFIKTIKNNLSSIDKTTLESLRNSVHALNSLGLSDENKVKLKNLIGQLETILSEEKPKAEKSKVNNREKTEESDTSHTTGGSSGGRTSPTSNTPTTLNPSTASVESPTSNTTGGSVTRQESTISEETPGGSSDNSVIPPNTQNTIPEEKTLKKTKRNNPQGKIPQATTYTYTQQIFSPNRTNQTTNQTINPILFRYPIVTIPTATKLPNNVSDSNNTPKLHDHNDISRNSDSDVTPSAEPVIPSNTPNPPAEPKPLDIPDNTYHEYDYDKTNFTSLSVEKIEKMINEQMQEIYKKDINFTNIEKYKKITINFLKIVNSNFDQIKNKPTLLNNVFKTLNKIMGINKILYFAVHRDEKGREIFNNIFNRIVQIAKEIEETGKTDGYQSSIEDFFIKYFELFPHKLYKADKKEKKIALEHIIKLRQLRDNANMLMNNPNLINEFLYLGLWDFKDQKDIESFNNFIQFALKSTDKEKYGTCIIQAQTMGYKLTDEIEKQWLEVINETDQETDLVTQSKYIIKMQMIGFNDIDKEYKILSALINKLNKKKIPIYSDSTFSMTQENKKVYKSIYEHMKTTFGDNIDCTLPNPDNTNEDEYEDSVIYTLDTPYKNSLKNVKKKDFIEFVEKYRNTVTISIYNLKNKIEGIYLDLKNSSTNDYDDVIDKLTKLQDMYKIMINYNLDYSIMVGINEEVIESITEIKKQLKKLKSLENSSDTEKESIKKEIGPLFNKIKIRKLSQLEVDAYFMSQENTSDNEDDSTPYEYQHMYDATKINSDKEGNVTDLLEFLRHYKNTYYLKEITSPQEYRSMRQIIRDNMELIDDKTAASGKLPSSTDINLDFIQKLIGIE